MNKPPITQGKWKPIDTAPDGTLVLARDKEGNQKDTWCEEGLYTYDVWEETKYPEERCIEISWEPVEWFDTEA